LRALNVQLYMDDFGTGYRACLTCTTFPIAVLKIDRSFVSRMGVGRTEFRNRCAPSSALARNLNLRVVAEGIESPEQIGNCGAWGATTGRDIFSPSRSMVWPSPTWWKKRRNGEWQLVTTHTVKPQ
jgi:EAL domain-containing protein (putative c-di-GMP-specific phosphodiesterase class I)